MTNQTNNVGIPTPVKIFSWILLCAGSFFFYVYTFNPSISFPNAVLDNYSAKVGFESAGVRIMGSLVAILISLIAKNPRWLLITLVSRAFIEFGDVVIGLINDGVTMNTYSLIILGSIELWAVSQLWKVTKSNP